MPQRELHHPSIAFPVNNRLDTLTFVPAYVEGLEDVSIRPGEYPVNELMVRGVYQKGLAGEPRNMSVGSSDILALLLVFSFLLVASAYRDGHKLLFQMVRYLFDVKERVSIFVDSTMNESRLRFSLLIQTFILEGIVIYCAYSNYSPAIAESHLPLVVGGGIVAVFLFYLSQFLVYQLLGYVFSDRLSVRLWIESFVSVNSLLGIVLYPIVLSILYLPYSITFNLILVAICYILSRIIFIYKGAKIFLRDSYGLVYFILYLCTLEIAPLLLLCQGVILLNRFIE